MNNTFWSMLFACLHTKYLSIDDFMKWTGHDCKFTIFFKIVSHTFSNPCKTRTMAPRLVLEVSNCRFVHEELIGISFLILALIVHKLELLESRVFLGIFHFRSKSGRLKTRNLDNFYQIPSHA